MEIIMQLMTCIISDKAVESQSKLHKIGGYGNSVEAAFTNII